MENIDEYDPLNIVDRIGADALRYTLLPSSTPGTDMNRAPRRLDGARHAGNTIWNAARFVVTSLGEPVVDVPFHDLSLEDRWIASRLNALIDEVTDLFDTHQYCEAGRRINDFLWSEFCDWYIEACKIRLWSDDIAAKSTAQAMLVSVLERALRLLHPYMPFVTEEIWQHLKRAWPGADSLWEESLMICRWPEADTHQIDAGAVADMDLLMDLIRQIRNCLLYTSDAADDSVLV